MGARTTESDEGAEMTLTEEESEQLFLRVMRPLKRSEHLQVILGMLDQNIHHQRGTGAQRGFIEVRAAVQAVAERRPSE